MATSIYKFNRELTHLTEGLSIDLGIPTTRVIRRAIGLLLFVDRELRSGNKVVVLEGNRPIKEIAL